MHLRRLGIVITLLVLAASACAPGGGAEQPPAGDMTEAGDTAVDEATCTPTTTDVESAPATLPDHPFPWDDPDAVALDGFFPEEVRRGGPPPDGIRPIDTPCVEPVPAGGAWLADQESLLVVEVDGEARGYPLAIMTQHEIVNDQLAGVPVLVTYCPLCNSGLAFERTVDGEVWDFGTSGRLLRSNLVMYDRQTRTLWSQFSGTALWGDPEVVGRELVRLPTQLLPWATFREAYPDGTVLGRDSFPTRTYGRNPYVGYEDDPSSFLYRGPTDQRLDPDERVVGIGDEAASVAVPLARLRDETVVTVDVGDEVVTVVWAPGQASAVDDAEVAAGRDVGQTGAFAVDGLEPAGDGLFRDPATGAVHDITGATVEGDAPPLVRVPLDDTFWFVWFAFRPDSAVAVG